jgi:UPF0755 protein
VATHLKHGRIKLFLALAAIVAAMALVLFWQRTQGFADHPLALEPGSAQVLLIEPGDGFNAVLGKLRQLGVTQGHDLEWKALATTLGAADHLQVGEYAVTPELTPRTLLLRLAKGEVIQRKFTIVEGWSFRELRAALQADPLLAHDLGKLGDDEVMARLKRRGVHPEGRFLPETYVYTRGSGETSILARAAKAMDAALASAWQARAPDLPLRSPDVLLTLASIV